MAKWYIKDIKLIYALRQIKNAEWETEKERTEEGQKILAKAKIARQNYDLWIQSQLEYFDKTKSERREFIEEQRESQMSRY